MKLRIRNPTGDEQIILSNYREARRIINGLSKQYSLKCYGNSKEIILIVEGKKNEENYKSL